MKTLFEKIGGEAAVDAAVHKFYDKVLADERIKHFFKNTDMDSQIKHQKRFLTVAFGGPNQYSGRSMSIAHRRLVNKMGLNDTHFDAVIENLAATLVELGVPENLIAEAGAIAGSVREQVLNRVVA